MFVFCHWTPAWASELENIGITEHLGTHITADLTFKNELGEEVKMGSFFDGQLPVILALVYYECPNLCTFVLNELTATLNKMTWEAGKHFRLVAVSIDPSENSQMALDKKQAYLAEYKKWTSVSAWSFLTGEEKNIRELAKEVGFGYHYDEKQKQYVHSAALFILTPEGKISRYFYGINYEPLDIKLALLEASGGKIGSFMDKLLFLCYHFFRISESKASEENKLPTPPPAPLGEKLFVEKGCISCHSPTGAPSAGPTLKGLFGREVELADGRKIIADENYIRESIGEPFTKLVKGFPPLMPAFKGTLTDPEINALVSYIKGLK